ncbi:hypothetical protein D3871_26215 [Noviherbaspirillum saxi]|uniref:Uncharacterized protein n=2 Tax=Noviherbaspirillum saxi TaxID=2320863 RepID=A0A3A3FG30_9BURK|nr:hypothetical protein D3871_26215 [Noviherbaspirillum saxi]
MGCVSGKFINESAQVGHLSDAGRSNESLAVVQHVHVDHRTPISAFPASSSLVDSRPMSNSRQSSRLSNTSQGSRQERLASAEVKWSRDNVQVATNGQEWRSETGDTMNEEQIDVLVDFMNIVRVDDVDELGVALPLALCYGRRRAFDAACAVYEAGIGDITEENAEGKTCLHMMAENLPDISPQWAEIDPSTGVAVPPVSLAERFERAFMLGADPFQAAGNGQSPIDNASDNGCLELLEQTMKRLTSEAVLAWCQGNSAVMSSLKNPGKGFHPLFGATANVLNEYLKALKTMNEVDDTYGSNRYADLCDVLAATRDTDSSTEWRQTLFASSISPECASTILHARIDARPGEPEGSWNSWCDQEWHYLLLNYDFEASSHQPLPSFELANMLVANDALPSQDLLATPEFHAQWTLYQQHHSAKMFFSEVQEGTRSFNEITQQEFSAFASQMYRIFFSLPPEACGAYCTELKNFLMDDQSSTSRFAFLQTAQVGSKYLDNMDDSAKITGSWKILIQDVSAKFFQFDQGRLSINLEAKSNNAYIKRQAMIAARRGP